VLRGLSFRSIVMAEAEEVDLDVIGPNRYLLARLGTSVKSSAGALTREAGSLVADLQRNVHDVIAERGAAGAAAVSAAISAVSARRTVQATLRALCLYPVNTDLVPEWLLVIDSTPGIFDDSSVRLAHYFLRESVPFPEEHYTSALEKLETQLLSSSPARRSAAAKTMARICRARNEDSAQRASDFLAQFFDTIGGVRFKTKQEKAQDAKDKRRDAKTRRRNGDAAPPPEAEEHIPVVDDGAGGTISTAAQEAQKIKSKFGKQVAVHSVMAAMRRVSSKNNVSAFPIEKYFLDSGLASITPSTVRHTMAILLHRLRGSPQSVAEYLLPRLAHKNPPPPFRLVLEDLGAKVYFARILSSLAQDPNLGRSPATVTEGATIANTMPTRRDRGAGVFQFLFNSITDTVSKGVSTVTGVNARLPGRNDPLGVEFAEALVSLLKNPSNRVLIEVLRGLARRKWATWTEVPIPTQALFGSPELEDKSSTAENENALDGFGEDDFEEEGELEDTENDQEGTSEKNIETEKRNSKFGGAEVSLEDDVALDAPEGGWNSVALNKGAFQRMKENRRLKREMDFDQKTPFYMRKVGAGSVTALEVIMRRIYASMLNDEAVRRFAAVDAVIALARAFIYGHSQEEMDELRKRRTAHFALRERKDESTPSTVAVEDDGHPLASLIVPLKELMEQDPSIHVRSRAALAALFIVGSGVDKWTGVQEDGTAQLPLLKLFGPYFGSKDCGEGIGLASAMRFIDALLFEILQIVPDLSRSTLELVEHWAMKQKSAVPAGRLLEVWEIVMRRGSAEEGCAVGDSICRCLNVGPSMERVACAAAIFLRRRALDVAVLTCDSAEQMRRRVPEPLPQHIGRELEKYCSALWHCVLLGPSAECSSLCVEALGGVAALAGDPFRIEIYERICELVKARGLGLRIVSERVLDCLDSLYACREKFAEAKERMYTLGGSSAVRENWVSGVWALAAQASSAAQILLGVSPPPLWLPLGPDAQRDVEAAEQRFGDYRTRGIKSTEAAPSLTRSTPLPVATTSLPSASSVSKKHVGLIGSNADETNDIAGSGHDSLALQSITPGKVTKTKNELHQTTVAAAAGLSAAYAVPSRAIESSDSSSTTEYRRRLTHE